MPGRGPCKPASTPRDRTTVHAVEPVGGQIRPPGHAGAPGPVNRTARGLLFRVLHRGSGRCAVGSIRSVLWIGAADDLMTTLASRSPTLDIVWEREVRPGLCLGREAFDAVVVDTKAAPALEVVRTLSRDSNAPVLVRVSPQEADRADALRRAGATRVVRRGDADQEQSLL